MRKEQDRNNLKALRNGESTHINWFEGGGGEVHRVWDMYVLFEVPQYGGEPRYVDTYHKSQLEDLLEKAHEWT